jgi:hypothetical protein
MSATNVPSWLLSASPGCAAIRDTGSNTAVYVKLDEWKAGTLPRNAPVDLRLVAWDSPPVFVCSLMVKLNDQDGLVFDAWVDAGTEEGTSILRYLANRKAPSVYVVADRVRHRFPAFVVPSVRDVALRLFQLSKKRADTWDKMRYQDLFQRVTRRYPNANALWDVSHEATIHNYG